MTLVQFLLVLFAPLYILLIAIMVKLARMPDPRVQRWDDMRPADNSTDRPLTRKQKQDRERDERHKRRSQEKGNSASDSDSDNRANSDSEHRNRWRITDELEDQRFG